jgi:predicted lipid-binding transport protein (Tim44 family)
MKRSGFRSFDALAGALFVALGIGGVLFFGWGELRLAFLLLIYFLLIIGFRLDDISRRLASIDRRLAVQHQRQATPDAARCPSDEIPPSASGSPR